MKNFILFLLFIFLISCNKTKNDEKLNIQNLSPQPSLGTIYLAPEHFKNMINTVALGLINMSQNSNFRTHVHTKIALRFDNEDDVLLKNLDYHPASGNTLYTELQNSINVHGNNSLILSHNVDNYNYSFYNNIDSIYNAVNGFNDVISNRSYKSYLHIFIPFFDSINLNTIPTIVVMNGDEDIARGYKLDQNGQLQVISVDENYAKNNLVWVVAVNERVDENGYYNSSNTGTTVIENSIKERMSFVEIQADSVAVVEKKESIFNGGPEVGLHLVRKNISSPCVPSEGLNELNINLIKCLYKNQLDKYFKSDNLSIFFQPWMGCTFDATTQQVGWALYEDDWMYTTGFIFDSCPSQVFAYDGKDLPFGIEQYFTIPVIPPVSDNLINMWFPGKQFLYPTGPNSPGKGKSNRIKLNYRRKS